MTKFFRTSKSNSTRINLAKTLAYSMVFWVVFLIILPTIIYSIESQYLLLLKPHKFVGGVLLALFSSLNIWSAIVMSSKGKGTPLPVDCASKLVIKGPYTLVRNPMAVGGIGQGVSVGLLIGSFFTIIYALIGAIIWHFLVRPTEERDLLQRFGNDFVDYKSTVGTWIPKINKQKSTA